MKYFEHDVEAHKDEKIVLLRREFGGAAVDAYWTLLEVIYREESELKPKQNPFGFQSVSFFLQVPEEQLAEWVGGMVKYGLLDADTDEQGAYVSIMSPRASENIGRYVSRSRTNAENGSKGGRPRKSAGRDGRGETAKTETKANGKRNESEAESETKATAKQTKPKWIEKEKEKEKEKERGIPPKPPADDFGEWEAGDGFAEYCKAALDMFNAETKSGIDYFDNKTFFGLRKAFDAGRTIDDLTIVTRDKRDEWANDPKMRRYIRPSTFYGEHFEEYLAVARRHEGDRSDFDEYA